MTTHFSTLAEAQAGLAAFGFSEDQQAAFAARAGDAAASNAVTGSLEPLAEDAILHLPPLGTPERAALRDAGLALIKAGKVGVVVLAGGMATRFGGVVKAIVPVLGERSFLELKHADVRAVGAAAGRPIPMYVMSSFATHAVIEGHAANRKLTDVTVFSQKVALRLTPQGALFFDGKGHLSPYATGHGDLTAALRDSGVLRRFIAAGGETLFMTNVDNLGATIDPAMVALHHKSGASVTAEVVRKRKGDAGGAPALKDGVPQIIEGFRFPKSFDQDRIGVFNTNTFFLDAKAIDRDFALPYYRVEKKVDGQPVIQFERLVGELTAFLPSRFVEVPREGEDCRFIPVKEPEDLAAQRPLIETVVASHRAVR